MPGTLWDIRGDNFRARGVVEDEQPARVGIAAVERVDDQLDGVVTLLRPEIRQAHPLAEVEQRVDDEVLLLTPHPPAQAVLIAELVRILGRDLRLADPAKPVERDPRLSDHRCRAFQKALAQLAELFDATGEVRVAEGDLTAPQHMTLRRPPSRLVGLGRLGHRVPPGCAPRYSTYRLQESRRRVML